MHKHIRFTLSPTLPYSAPDGHPDVLHGVWRDDDGTAFAVEAGTGRSFPISGIRLLPPCSPSKIICVGRNYADHAKELGNAVPQEPIIFLKPPSSLNGHNGAIVFPRLSQMLNFEGEVGVVIGSRARNLPAAKADSCIAGYTVVNDVTARDLQKKDGQWTRGKGFDTFCPVGAWWVPKEEVDWASVRVRTLVNGEVKQDGSVNDMLFPVAAIIEYVSAFLTLEQGDLIATGTPPGVGPIAPGDTVRVEVSGVGFLENSVVAE